MVVADLRFRESVKIMPGVRLNLSKSGVSSSIGCRGASVIVSKRGVRPGFPCLAQVYLGHPYLVGTKANGPVPLMKSSTCAVQS